MPDSECRHNAEIGTGLAENELKKWKYPIIDCSTEEWENVITTSEYWTYSEWTPEHVVDEIVMIRNEMNK